MVKCPELEGKGILKAQFCRGIILKEMYARWGEAPFGIRIIGLR